MKKIISFILYETHIYFKSSKFIMPLIFIASFLGIMYSVKPTDVVSSILISCNFVFCLMAWIGLRAVSTEQDTSEQLMFLRMGDWKKYIIAKVLFLCFLSILVGLVCVFYPMLNHMINGNNLFTRPLSAQDVIHAIILEFSCALNGGAVGSLFHPIIVKDRKIAIILTVLVAVLAVTQPFMYAKALFFRLGYILPPVYLVSKVYGNVNNFNRWNTTLLTAGLILYTCMLFLIRMALCRKKKYM